MEVFEAILTRRSTRKFKKEKVDEERLRTIVEAGRMAPSGSNSQQCHFLVVTREEVLDRLASLVESAFAKMDLTEDLYISLKNSIRQSKKGGYVFFYGAPALVIVANNKDYGNNIADSVIAVGNMMLAANALDMGSCFINQLKWLNEDPEIVAYLQELGMKENERVYASVALGFPDTADGLPARTPLKRTGNEVTYIR